MLFSLKNRKKDDKKQEEKDKKSEDKKKPVKMDDLGDELDFENDIPMRKSERRQDSSFDFISDFGNDFLDNSGPHAPPRSRKTAGWSEDTPSKKSWLRRGSKSFVRDSPKKEVFMDTSPVTSDIPVIPDLDDMKEEELSADIAKAPRYDGQILHSIALYAEANPTNSMKWKSSEFKDKVFHTVSRIATYQELDSDLSKHTAFQSLDGIDLTLLTKRLLPEHIVRKEDETPWTWDTLFADVSSHFNATMSQDANMNVSEKNFESLEK